MKGSILVTDTLFILDEHVEQLENAGYEVIRVEKPDMNEEELILALKSKVGYILGGIERVTDRVFASTNDLKAIVFTGTGIEENIPGWESALKKGVRIGCTPYANVYEVAEWGLAATLAMQRDLFSLGPRGFKKSQTVKSLPDISIGIVGLGHIGKKYADMLSSLGAGEVSYWSKSKKAAAYTYKDLEELFESSDCIFVAVADDAGHNFIDKTLLSRMKDGSLIVSISHQGIINENDLYAELQSGRLRAALDCVKDLQLFQDLPLDIWYGSSASAAYNSSSYLMRSSDMAVKTLLNLLGGREDENEIR